MQHRSRGALIGAALLTLAACGSGSDGAASPVVDEQPAAAPVADGISDETDVASTPASADEQTGAPNEAEVAQPAPTEAPEPEQAAETEAQQSAPSAQPVVGGRLFAADVQPVAQFDGNPFPDLVVDDIGKDAQVNIKNILPSDRPVLLWAWAPH